MLYNGANISIYDDKKNTKGDKQGENWVRHFPNRIILSLKG